MIEPRVGDVVLYTNLGDSEGRYPPEQQAAIITKIENPKSGKENERRRVSLAILYPTGMFFMSDVGYSPEFRRGFWTDRR